MIFKLKPFPKEGDKRIKKCFAFFPSLVEIDDDGDGSGAGTLEGQALPVAPASDRAVIEQGKGFHRVGRHLDHPHRRVGLLLGSGILELGEQGDPVLSYRSHDLLLSVRELSR